ncbi:MAG: hypothetical protein MKZ95_18300, partial [Pirellulales bacterium]|nr:hypothetical protein [Pirellulales bacterium]
QASKLQAPPLRCVLLAVVAGAIVSSIEIAIYVIVILIASITADMLQLIESENISWQKPNYDLARKSQ